MNPTASDGTPLDPTAAALTRAIRYSESQGNYNAQGASGEFGAYQFLPETYSSMAKQFGFDPNDRSPVTQDKIAYKAIEAQLKEGHTQSQVASWWNSGKYDPTGNVGVNKEGVKYDTPAYVQRVQKAYTAYANGQDPAGGFNPRPFSNSMPGQFNFSGGVDTTQQPAQQDPNSLGGELQQRGQDATAALGQASTGLSELGQGNIGGAAEDIGSGALQTAGAVAGGAGDIIQKGLELIPGVKSLESGIANILGGIADTSLGKSVISGVTQFAQAHPEVAKDIGAAVNIASVLPMFKVFTAIPGIAKDAIGMATKNSLMKAAGEEMTGVASKTIGGREVLSVSGKRGLNPVQTILDSGALPEVVVGADGVPRYSTARAFEAMSTNPEEEQLSFALKNAPATAGGQMSLEDSRKAALKAVAKEFENRTDYDAAIKETNAIFNSYEARFGKNVFLDKVNDLKRGVRESVNFKSDKLHSDIHYIIGQSLMDDVESGAKRLGVKGVPELNKAMAEKINARRLLKAMNDKQPRLTTTGKFSRAIKKGAAGMAGEAVGSAFGMPFAGTLTGMGLEGALIKNAPDSALYKLSQLGQSNIRSTAKKGLIGAGLLGAQRARQSQ